MWILSEISRLDQAFQCRDIAAAKSAKLRPSAIDYARLVDVRFSPDGEALCIADFGAMAAKDNPLPIRHTGLIWRMVPEATNLEYPSANLSW